MRQFATFMCLIICTGILQAQEMTRRSFLGIQMENITPDVKRIMDLNDSVGVLINNVVPGSTAAAAGFMKGDILLKINDEVILNTQQAVTYVGRQKSNSSFTYELLRDKKKLTGNAAFKPYPLESYADLDVIYTQAKTDLGVQRLIITRPKNKSSLPIVFFIGGIGCYSLDAPLDTSRSELQLLNKISRSGFITVRLEKPGIGDAFGYSKACNEVGFHEEADNYAQVINDLRKRQGFSGNKTYIIGHSMGGVMAPLVAAKTKIDGIIAYGTIGSNFIEYLAKTRRTIGEAYGWAPDETDAYIKDYCECAAYYFSEKMTTAEAIKRKSDCGELLSVFDLRSRTYNDELYALNIPASWKNYEGKALLAWGESDYIASKEDHEIIAQAINYYHKNNGSFVSIPAADHGMSIAETFREARTSPGGYNRQVGNIFLDWLRKQSS